VWDTGFDPALKDSIRQIKQIPVWINYSVGSQRNEKPLDNTDRKRFEKIANIEIPYWYPSNRMMSGKETRRNDPQGLTHVHHFYYKDSLFWLAALKERSDRLNYRFLVTYSLINTLTKLYRYVVKKPDYKGQGGGLLSGTLYAPSLVRALSATSSYKRGVSRLSRIFKNTSRFSHDYLLATGDAAQTGISDSSIDYLFIDPPFGSNLYYSELSHFWESWLKVFSSIENEAVENSAHGKGVEEYRLLITKAFREAYRVLKPGRWMTVEFSNTKASVWNSIQTALTDAGFIVANVSALDKKQGSFKAVTTPTAVKQDLVISAYKPNGGFEERFQKEAETEEGVWDFVRTHLKYLPVTKRQGALLQFIPERDPRILFDQMVAYYVRKGYPVPISSQEFQVGLAQRFDERDGMYFLPDQVAEYDRKMMTSDGGLTENIELFVKDEESMIKWLRHHLRQKPQTFADINPQFMQQLGGWSKNEAQLDLRELLNQNFICYDGKGKIPAQIISWMRQSSKWRPIIEKEFQAQGIEIGVSQELETRNQELRRHAADRWYVPDPNKAGDLEKLREKALLKEFEEYKQRKGKFKRGEKFRMEAIRAGFKKAWQERDYQTIINVAEKIPNKILEEDPKLLMWYDQAVTRMGDSGEELL